MRSLLFATVILASLSPAVWADGPPARKDLKDAKEVKPEVEASRVARILASLVDGFAGLLTEKDALKRVEGVEKMLDSVFDGMKSMHSERDWKDLQVLLESYTKLVKVIGPKQFDAAYKASRRNRTQAKKTAPVIVRMYTKLKDHVAWMTRTYNDKAAPKPVLPVIKEAVKQTNMLIQRFISWYLVLPGIKTPLAQAAAELKEKAKGALQGAKGKLDQLPDPPKRPKLPRIR